MAADKRIKASITASMYDMCRTMQKGINDSVTNEQKQKALHDLSLQRWKDAENKTPAYAPPGLPDKVTEDTDSVTAMFAGYYKTNRGFHVNSLNSNGSWTVTNAISFMNFDILTFIKDIAPRPILLIAGDHAHSKYFSDDIYKNASEPKELLIIEDANHVDLYDNLKKIPFEKITKFLNENLK
ncbi:opdE downstream ORF 2, putative [Trichomonas vaginalis G3]|uniref:OpdE downstream ORF 2, putative n=1 Tax=Trichomonas vaginalis (strain ATCC PRA-98 / G3) TaxID=412133 RepID=A2DXR9_TRIV3|nr:thiolester hydrolase protein [Trichomonas vaginalis G3]EAY14779.1 opdE downstream ORF 2, putative [Trichomonas vaginalis G3]KAI5508053.1 thiolester hydrolase protein [Trichomonas vaginalis G3]|eukprot:XP_001327002.1 opdE downstream ORF 2 [Trichomonas vaginalis G3]